MIHIDLPLPCETRAVEIHLDGHDEAQLPMPTDVALGEPKSVRTCSGTKKTNGVLFCAGQR